MELDESDSIAPLDESLQSMPSDDEEQWYWKMRSIYRVPARITALTREAYQPQVVSFGPYHHGEAHLLPMEEHKRRTARHFLKRSKKPMECFFASLREVACDLEESYDALDPKWKAGSGEGAAPLFLELMITDGCFMLEILRFATNEVDDYASNDPIFSNHGTLYIMSDIWQDMLMLENQLPMLVLYRLVAVESDGEKDTEFVNRLIHNLCLRRPRVKMMGKCLHALDVYRKCMLMEPEKKDELSKHGIRFRKSKTNSLKDISFTDGVLRLPVIWVDSITMSRFLNLTAFERLHVGAGNDVMSYIYCMDQIIRNEQDVLLLRDNGILRHHLKNDEMVVKMFDSLAEVVMVDYNANLIDVLDKVNAYCGKKWSVWRANLLRTYFRNPVDSWSFITFVLLFALTAIQTVYSVHGSHK
ncbi:hypothetical protein ACJRO7_004625 [Eucalyptus globulus]|uniref:Uncharacterized protein n=1 Tax=Eucalyptus globulus TaxID=34317 RepID=A0ABD3J108_EUCGL